jgi:hypothetical protein
MPAYIANAACRVPAHRRGFAAQHLEDQTCIIKQPAHAGRHATDTARAVKKVLAVHRPISLHCYAGALRDRLPVSD